MSVSLRRKMVDHLLEYEGRLVLWGELDCSEYFSNGLLWVGQPDYRQTKRAQDFADMLAPTKEPELGDPAFYGKDWQHVVHVAMHIGGGRVISASGASKHIRTVPEARAAGARVRIYPRADYRRDFLGWRKAPLPSEREPNV